MHRMMSKSGREIMSIAWKYEIDGIVLCSCWFLLRFSRYLLRLESDVFKHDLRKFNDRQQLMAEREKIVYVVTIYYAKKQIE